MSEAGASFGGGRGGEFASPDFGKIVIFVFLHTIFYLFYISRSKSPPLEKTEMTSLE